MHQGLCLHVVCNRRLRGNARKYLRLLDQRLEIVANSSGFRMKISHHFFFLRPVVHYCVDPAGISVRTEACWTAVTLVPCASGMSTIMIPSSSPPGRGAPKARRGHPLLSSASRTPFHCCWEPYLVSSIALPWLQGTNPFLKFPLLIPQDFSLSQLKIHS
jgi:hypothetical protein